MTEIDDIVRIVPSPNDGGGYQQCQMTKFYAGDQELHGIASASVHYRVDDLVKADLEVYAFMDEVTAVATFFIHHPVRNKLIAVKKIEFADGEVLEL